MKTQSCNPSLRSVAFPNPKGKAQFCASGLSCGMLSVCAFALVGGQRLQAAAITWDGSASTAWETGANWSGNNAPVAADTVTIGFGNAGAIVNNTSALATSLQLGGSAANTYGVLGFSTTVPSKLTVSGTVTVGGSGSTNTNRRGEIIFQSGATLEAGSVVLTQSTNGADPTKNNPGIINMTNGGLLKTGSLAVGVGVTTWTPGVGTVELTAGNTLPSTVFTSFYNLNINHTSAGTTTLGAATTVTGTLAVSAGTLTASYALGVTSTTSVAGNLNIASTGTLTGAGGVSIAGGKFNYNSSTALAKALSFSGTGGTLSGTGTINTAVTVTSNNTYSAGAVGDPGTQSLAGGITLNTGSVFSWDLDATNGADPGVLANQGTYDKVTGNGSGGGVFNVILGTNLFSNAFWNTNKTWNNIFSGTDPSFGTFGGSDGISSVASSGLVAGQGQFSYSSGTLIWTAVPEPTSALAGLLLGTGLLRRRRI